MNKTKALHCKKIFLTIYQYAAYIHGCYV